MIRSHRRRLLMLLGGAILPRDIVWMRNAAANQLLLEADCIHAWAHATVGVAFNALFAGVPFGPIPSGPDMERHWLLGKSVRVISAHGDRCARFGPSAQRVPEANFEVRWLAARVDVFGRRYCVVSNLAQRDLISYPPD